MQTAKKNWIAPQISEMEIEETLSGAPAGTERAEMSS